MTAGTAAGGEQSGHQGAQALVSDAGCCQQGGAQGAGQGHDPRIAESESRGPPPVRVGGRVRDPLKGWTRKDGALAGTFNIQYAPVAGPGLVLQLREVRQAGVALQVTGRVDDGLDPHRPAVLEAAPPKRGGQAVPVRLVGHISSASHCAQRSSSASVGGQVTYARRICARWYSIVRPRQEYLANSAGSTFTSEPR